MSEAFYLFCFANNDLVGDTVSGFGLTEDSDLFKTSFRDLAMIVAKVSLEEFAGPGSDERLNSVEWVTPRALRHGQVVQDMSERSPVLPASFGSLFSSVDRLISLAESNYDVISNFLELIKDRQEWAIKAYLDRQRLKTSLFKKRLDGMEDELSKLSPGVRYFREKQLQTEIDKEIMSKVNSEINKIADDLAVVSDYLQTRKAGKTAFDENDKELVAKWAILVNVADMPKLEALITAKKSDPMLEGIELGISGPWPPYSFAPALQMEDQK